MTVIAIKRHATLTRCSLLFPIAKSLYIYKENLNSLIKIPNLKYVLNN